jgi:hypothetical protein
MKRTFAAAIFALLITAAPARAATIDFSVDLDFPEYNNVGAPVIDAMTGILDFSVDPSNGNYYLDGSQVSVGGAPTAFVAPGNSNTPPVTTTRLFVAYPGPGPGW